MKYYQKIIVLSAFLSSPLLSHAETVYCPHKLICESSGCYDEYHLQPSAWDFIHIQPYRQIKRFEFRQAIGFPNRESMAYCQYQSEDSTSFAMLFAKNQNLTANREIPGNQWELNISGMYRCANSSNIPCPYKY